MIGTAFWPQQKWLQYFLALERPLRRRVVTELTENALPAIDPGLAPIFGKWEWLRSSGRGGQGKSPISAGYMHTLELNPDGTLTIFKNEEIYATGSFRTVAPLEENGKPKLIFKYNYCFVSKREAKFSFKFIGTNTLCFTEEATFRYNQHLFLRQITA